MESWFKIQSNTNEVASLWKVGVPGRGEHDCVGRLWSPALTLRRRCVLPPGLVRPAPGIGVPASLPSGSTVLTGSRMRRRWRGARSATGCDGLGAGRVAGGAVRDKRGVVRGRVRTEQESPVP